MNLANIFDLNEKELDIYISGLHSTLSLTSKYLCDYIHNKLREKKKNPYQIIHTTKEEGDNKGQYGYYCGHWNIKYILRFAHKFNIRNLMEIGAGTGFITYVLNNSGIRTIGIEIEKDLCSLLYEGNTKFLINSDIFNVPKVSYAKIQAVYFWECFNSNDLNIKFHEYLSSTLPVGCMIMYACSGGMLRKLLDDNERFESIPHNEDNYGFYLFKKVK